MEFFRNISLSDFIAIGGLLIASISLGWNILNEIRKHPKADVSCMIANTIPNDGKDYFNITITNISKRPIQILGVGFIGYKWWWHPFKKKQFIFKPQNLPKYLSDGERVHEMYPYTTENFKNLIDNNIQKIFVYDSVGRNHYVSRKNLIAFRKHIKSFTKKKESENLKK
jgi:hypothetical protein